MSRFAIIFSILLSWFRSFAIISWKMIPFMCKGLMIPDLIAILAGIDYVMADVDR